MKKIFKKIIKRVLWILPPKIAHKILYRHRMHKKLDLKNPKDFNEKIQWLILNDYKTKKIYSNLADKVLVREYIKEKNYENILPKIYGIYDDFSDIDFSLLPKRFVLKPNNGCGNVFIYDEKVTKEEFELYVKKLRNNLKKNFALNNLEYHYKNIKPKIIVEEYLDDSENKVPLDYKIYCYNGKAECILVCSEREKLLRLDYYDLTWQYLPFSKEEYRADKRINCPFNLAEMIKIAENLSKGFPFVRIDLYNIQGKIYFGEMTFTPAAGLVNYNTKEALLYLGSLINIKK